MNPAWQVDRVAGVEVFTAPDGTQYVRASAVTATVTLQEFKTPGLPPLYLRPRSAEQILKAVARRERRLERRLNRKVVVA